MALETFKSPHPYTVSTPEAPISSAVDSIVCLMRSPFIHSYFCLISAAVAVTVGAA